MSQRARGPQCSPRGQLPEHRQHREGWGRNLAAGKGDWKILSTPVPLSLWVSMWLGYSVCDSEISSSISSVVMLRWLSLENSDFLQGWWSVSWGIDVQLLWDDQFWSLYGEWTIAAHLGLRGSASF